MSAREKRRSRRPICILNKRDKNFQNNMAVCLIWEKESRQQTITGVSIISAGLFRFPGRRREGAQQGVSPSLLTWLGVSRPLKKPYSRTTLDTEVHSKILMQMEVIHLYHLTFSALKQSWKKKCFIVSLVSFWMMSWVCVLLKNCR